MSMASSLASDTRNGRDLRRFYFIRAAFALAWIAAVAMIGRSSPSWAALLIIAYPAWDAVANVIDARGIGERNLPQWINAAVSMAAAVLIALALPKGIGGTIVVFGGWAIVAGLMQLTVGVRRWRTVGGQWAMVLSGAQSMLVGGLLIGRAQSQDVGITALVPYAAFGALYFLIAALWLVWTARRTR